MDAHNNKNSTESFLDYVLAVLCRELQDARHQQRLSSTAWPSTQALIEKILMYEMLVNQMERTITDLVRRCKEIEALSYSRGYKDGQREYKDKLVIFQATQQRYLEEEPMELN